MKQVLPHDYFLIGQLYCVQPFDISPNLCLETSAYLIGSLHANSTKQYQMRTSKRVKDAVEQCFSNEGSAEPQAFASGCQGLRRDRPILPFLPTWFINESRIDTRIIAQGSLSKANICGSFPCAQRLKNTAVEHQVKIHFHVDSVNEKHLEV